jgi:4-hydroxy-tetrahydrodipicolinate reductase
MKVGIVGAGGRMGRLLVQLAHEAEGMTVAAASELPDSPLLHRDVGDLAGIGPIGVVVGDSAEAVFEAADIVIEFSVPQATADHAALAAKHGASYVTGTTGLDPAQEAALAEAGNTVPILYAPNMSVAVNLFMSLVQQVAGVLGPDYDIEILEMHHKYKIDAPSGTAVGLGKAAAKGRGVDLDDVAIWSREGETGVRPDGAIGFATLRGADVVGEHTVMFASAGERMEFTHRCTDRSLFARGAIRGAQWISDKPPGLYAMADVLGIEGA